MSIIEEKLESRLPHKWRDEVVELLASDGISITKMQVTNIKTQKVKNDPNEKKVLEAIIRVKENYRKRQEKLQKLRSIIS